MKSAMRVAAVVWICANGTASSAQQAQSTEREHREPVKIVRQYKDGNDKYDYTVVHDARRVADPTLPSSLLWHVVYA